MAGNWSDAIRRAQAHSPFLAQALERQPELAALLAAGEGEAAMEWATAAGEGATSVGVALRRERLALATALAIGDLAGAFPLARVTGELSAFADRALDAAITDAIALRVPDAEPQGFFALALGKHGAGELNYSSDIDPILLFDPATLPRRERDEPGEAAQRYARRIVQTLSEVTAEGYVFRVDLRLRPASEVSPLAIPVGAALTHYESSALVWERAAFIRARACSGDIAAGEDFLDAINSFVWRKSLDFGAIDEIDALTRQVRAHHEGTGAVGPGFDVKRGRGGIREIEFFAQTHQLIHGGRDRSLRVRGTRESLDALAKAERIPTEDAKELGEAYDALREVEHRLQMVNDRQTHRLPEAKDRLDNVAQLAGLDGSEELIAHLAAITGQVARRYDALVSDEPESSGSPEVLAPMTAAAIAEMGFDEPQAIARRIETWRSGKYRALSSDAALAAFATIQPRLLEALAQAPEPRDALNRWERLLARLPSAINLFRLLEARPGLLALLGRVLSLAPPLADELARRADLLDPLIDASAFRLPGSVGQLEALLVPPGADGEDYELVLDRVRRRVSELRFALGVQLIEARADALDVGAALSRVAEATIAVLARATQAEFAQAHGSIAGSELAILGLGRLGGGMLTHSSDLDLIFLFTGDLAGESDGERPLGPTRYYNRLSQRVIAALSVPTAEGALYEVDTRLRPSGAQGPPAASIESFARYQREDAWTWEHMALARARPMFASPQCCARLAQAIEDTLCKPRDPDKLRDDVLEMRATMAEHKPSGGPLDVKLLRGGLVDIEFIVHFLQLRDGIGLTPELGDAIDTLADAGLVDAALRAAHDDLTRTVIAARLLAPGGSLPSAAAGEALARTLDCSDWSAAEARLDHLRHIVARQWQATFGQKLEIEP